MVDEEDNDSSICVDNPDDDAIKEGDNCEVDEGMDVDGDVEDKEECEEVVEDKKNAVWMLMVMLKTRKNAKKW